MPLNVWFLFLTTDPPPPCFDESQIQPPWTTVCKSLYPVDYGRLLQQCLSSAVPLLRVGVLGCVDGLLDGLIGLLN